MEQSSGSSFERFDDGNDQIRSKRIKRESSLTGKNIVVFKSDDVARRDDLVFMPNTIEMAYIKKRGMGQFKTNVEFSSMMSEDDVSRILVENFPLLEGQRFYCAAAADSRTRLEFHGEPRLWNGRYIKKWIKGNSALYILIDLEVMESETLLPFHDQINGDEDTKTEEGLRLSETVHKQSEQLANEAREVMANLSMLDDPTKNKTHQLTGLTGTAGIIQPTSSLTSINPTSSAVINHQWINTNDGETRQSLRHVSSDQLIVKNEHVTRTQEPTNMASNQMRSGACADSPAGRVMQQQALPIGAPVVFIPNKKSQSTTGEQAINVFKVPSHVNMVSGLQPAQQCIFISPQMTNAHISCAASQQSLQPVYMKTAQSECVQTMQAFPSNTQQRHQIKDAPTRKHVKVESCQRTPHAATGTGGAYHGLPLSSASEISESDSGIESGGSFPRSDTSKSSKTTELAKMDEVEQSEYREFVVGFGNPLLLLSGVASKIRSATEKNSIVGDICPNSSSVKGGPKFYIILEESLAPDLNGVQAYFGKLGPVPLTVINEYNLIGIIPPAQNSCVVTVEVQTTDGQYLGESLFEYVDEVQDVLRLLIQDKQIQKQLFLSWAQELDNKREPTGSGDRSKPDPSGVKTEAAWQTGPVPVHVDEVQEILREPDVDLALQSSGSSSEDEDSGYSSEDEDLFVNATAQQTGPVPVTVDEVQEILRQLDVDPALQSIFFNLWAQEYGNFWSDGDVSQTLQWRTADDESGYDADGENISSGSSSEDEDLFVNATAQQTGPVPVYVDEVQEILRQLDVDLALQSLFFNLWAQEYGNFWSDGDVSQTLQLRTADDESGYDADGENISSGSSSEDEDLFVNATNIEIVEQWTTTDNGSSYDGDGESSSGGSPCPSLEDEDLFCIAGNKKGLKPKADSASEDNESDSITNRETLSTDPLYNSGNDIGEPNSGKHCHMETPTNFLKENDIGNPSRNEDSKRIPNQQLYRGLHGDPMKPTYETNAHEQSSQSNAYISVLLLNASESRHHVQESTDDRRNTRDRQRCSNMLVQRPKNPPVLAVEQHEEQKPDVPNNVERSLLAVLPVSERCPHEEENSRYLSTAENQDRSAEILLRTSADNLAGELDLSNDNDQIAGHEHDVCVQESLGDPDPEPNSDYEE